MAPELMAAFKTRSPIQTRVIVRKYVETNVKARISETKIDFLIVTDEPPVAL
jgi:hypothetical protein